MPRDSRFEDWAPHIEGWLYDETARLTDALLGYQSARGLVGDLLEIGVYAGRYFLVLANASLRGERCVAVDIFKSQEPRIPGSAHGDLDTFLANVRRYAPSCELICLQQDSVDFAASEAADLEEGMYRFVSVDGGHETETVYSDLLLAERLILKGGIIALDDWNHEEPLQWPGVQEAFARYDLEAHRRNKHPRLQIIAEVPNKLLLTNDPTWRSDYQQVLRQWDGRHGDAPACDVDAPDAAPADGAGAATDGVLAGR